MLAALEWEMIDRVLIYTISRYSLRMSKQTMHRQDERTAGAGVVVKVTLKKVY